MAEAQNSPTPVGSTTAGQIAVAAESTVATRMSAPPSFDVADFPVPHGREEEWRFTPLERLRGLHDGTAVATGQGVKVVVEAPEGVTVETVGRDDPRLGKAGTPVDRVAAQAYSAFEQASVVTVPKETVLTEPIRIAVHGEGGTAFGHQVVELGAFAEAVVVIDHTGDAVLAANVDYVLGDGAKLTVVSVQDWDDSAVHVAQHNALVGRDASFKSVVVTFGGDLVRLHPRVNYAGPGGEAELYGLYFTDAGQHQEHRLFVDHGAPHCKSNVAYKGALQGDDAHAVWIGDVLIEAKAEGTDTYEMNRNLVLTDGARVDSVPNLEIETGEIVGAGHASATGRFDDEQLFYLMARGIPESEARRLVVRGFFAELVQQIGVKDIEERLLAKIEHELEASVA
ncbi:MULTISPECIES: Fe-S cluster assembly protein SufD [Streptomyces]|uniref:Fe-S cluster assembly protein SufD n=1 Tax=Streptomyces thermoviolaceus subsp. thermoviolaceus TaxID=66860 RepID=A0ABX0YTF9_STRTL|nr:MULTISPECIES: Fe-S cluster assembly protein SufD [Streptomyces]MCM3265801.1 Fe-S cluster assembly protein SufD [Streptomyces thermoviolaceus]NJP14416.1 Fe-S cluster assembly protein SufD [Streptomyces thermoviolaceus subsp. thermoviolaceus]RSS06567.1 Fe-S cluster assembly protein SufD [Streptomyces sp. WAC00469]WTD49709.1 Fe-S cluster assembly protein SufD [Streptomyces thermoviolaceus]GGV81231.1 Fe-S cluster assembly protein SufD [Streptomyces thermoviolaceus subsp. apingens]